MKRPPLVVLYAVAAIAGLVLGYIIGWLTDGDDRRGDDDTPAPKPPVPPSLEVLAEGQRRKRKPPIVGAVERKPKQPAEPATVPT